MEASSVAEVAALAVLAVQRQPGVERVHRAQPSRRTSLDPGQRPLADERLPAT